MRFLHTSDLHIGKRVNGVSLWQDQRFVLDQIISIAREREVDAVLVAGDIYDKTSPSAEAVTVFDAFLTTLADLGIDVLAVPGNHDSAERIAYARGLIAGRGVNFPSVFDGRLEPVSLEDEHGRIDVWLVPFLRPGDVRRFHPDTDIGDDFQAALGAVFAQCEIDVGVRNVAVSHQLVTAAGKSPERADEEIKLGGIDNVDVSLYDKFDYVALGHVHRPQRVGRDTVRYAGSPLKYSLSEARYEKSVAIVQVGPKEVGDKVGACVDVELVALKPLHDVREVSGTLEWLLAEGRAHPESANDYLHATLTDEHPQLDAMVKLREVYPNALSLDYSNMTIAAARMRTRTAVDPDKLDTVDLFARFYEEQVGKPLDDEQHAIVSRVVGTVKDAEPQGFEAREGGGK